ncbi:peroxiredoxin [Halomonas sediminis]|uniref:Glutathione-dependent peroxiredoxin n=1 Tax=Vreelandella zhuhanensis TaxID=2684210 RepID=A0A7X3KP75_9GAMM|nr:peroxiredoxin [Halomonas zhuhanensis]MWJ27120.1 redoxin family protein [Halomonas zhuhanensis]
MTISVGEKIPDITIKTNGPEGPQDISTGELFADKRVVLFAVPGAFTPGCSNTHMPGFVVNADKIFEKGVDTIACMAVNDAFVLDAWQKNQNAQAFTMLADGNAEFTKALGLELDASGAGMGTRCKRFALIADDGVVNYIGVDSKGVKDSSAETVLELLSRT